MRTRRRGVVETRINLEIGRLTAKEGGNLSRASRFLVPWIAMVIRVM